MSMNSKLARRLVSAVAVGALALGGVACGQADDEEQRTETPRRVERTTPTKMVTEEETITEIRTK